MRRSTFLILSRRRVDVANAVGVTHQTFMAIDGDKYSPTLGPACRRAEVFGTPLDAVFRYLKPTD